MGIRNVYERGPIFCGVCGKEIDPQICWCGDDIDKHTAWCGHAPVPMGCECGYYRKPKSHDLSLFLENGVEIV